MSLSNQDAESTLAPYVKRYTEANSNLEYVVIESMYHPDGVVVEKGKKALYGRKDIIESFHEFAEMTGKSVPSLTNLKYQGVKDYIILSGDFSAETEKVGTVKGAFVQVWKREGDVYLIYHDEYEVAQ